MSYLKKRQKITNETTTKHSDLELEEYDEKHVFVKLLNPDYKDYWEDNLYDVNAIWKRKGWIVNRMFLDKLKVIMNMNNESDEDIGTEYKDSSKKKPKNEKKYQSDEEEEYSDDSSSTDDELVQKALARRLMSESTQKSIEEEVIEDSELEDVVSVCRRFRFLYCEIKRLRQRVSELEKRV